MEFLRQTDSDISSESQNGTHPMIAAIEAGVQGSDWRQTGHFMVPYHRQIDGKQYDFWLRRRHFYPRVGPEIVIDLGTLEDPEDFVSVASVDISVQNTIDDLPNRSPIKPNIGVIQTNISMPWFDGIMCARSRDYADQYMGIYVDDALRGNKIGTSLISAARIVLRNEDVRQLVVDRITEIRAGTQTGEFYRRLGGKIFYVKVDHLSTPKLSIPTKSSRKYPYRFE